jgi:hypothetical protein
LTAKKEYQSYSIAHSPSRAVVRDLVALQNWIDSFRIQALVEEGVTSTETKRSAKRNAAASAASAGEATVSVQNTEPPTTEVTISPASISEPEKAADVVVDCDAIAKAIANAMQAGQDPGRRVFFKAQDGSKPVNKDWGKRREDQTPVMQPVTQLKDGSKILPKPKADQNAPKSGITPEEREERKKFGNSRQVVDDIVRKANPRRICPKCDPVCHLILKCPVLRSWTPTDRANAITKDYDRCGVCFKPGAHRDGSECKGIRCRICVEDNHASDHHIFLHGAHVGDRPIDVNSCSYQELLIEGEIEHHLAVTATENDDLPDAPLPGQQMGFVRFTEVDNPYFNANQPTHSKFCIPSPDPDISGETAEALQRTAEHLQVYQNNESI